MNDFCNSRNRSSPWHQSPPLVLQPEGHLTTSLYYIRLSFFWSSASKKPPQASLRQDEFTIQETATNPQNNLNTHRYSFGKGNKSRLTSWFTVVSMKKRPIPPPKCPHPTPKWLPIPTEKHCINPRWLMQLFFAPSIEKTTMPFHPPTITKTKQKPKQKKSTIQPKPNTQINNAPNI